MMSIQNPDHFHKHFAAFQDKLTKLNSNKPEDEEQLKTLKSKVTMKSQDGDSSSDDDFDETEVQTSPQDTSKQFSFS